MKLTKPKRKRKMEVIDGSEPISEWFNLTYASWLTLPRILLEDMPVEWQRKMKALLDELDEAYPNAPCGHTRVNLVKAGKLAKTPEWLLNYRRPDREEIEKCKKFPSL